MFVISLALVAVFVLGVGTRAWLLWVGTPDEDSVDTRNEMPGDDSAEAGFARDMIVHHIQAVQMAEIVRNKTESEKMRLLASDMALVQQGQIGQMQGWLAVWGLPPTGAEPAMSWMGHPTGGRIPGMASPEEIEELSEAPPEVADERFLRLMIPHHQAALTMTEAVTERTDRSEVERLAHVIVASQEAEIESMQNMLEGGDASLPEENGHSGEEHHDHD